MDKVIKTLERELAIYAKDPLNGRSWLTTNEDKTLYAVVGVAHLRDQRYADLGLLVRLKDNCIIIEHDANNKPLVDALIQAGIPRDQIVLAYAGEVANEAA